MSQTIQGQPGNPPGSGGRARRSVFGGLLLILIGVLFLLHRHFPFLEIGHILRAYWPVLLIAWGVAKLIDNFTSRGADGTRPPLVSGGEIALIFVFIFIVAGMAGYDRVREKFPDLDVGD